MAGEPCRWWVARGRDASAAFDAPSADAELSDATSFDAEPPDATSFDAGPPVTPPLVYLSACDSPYSLRGMGTDAFLETFEGAVLVPGVTASTGSRIGPGGLTDSVDGDDGALDGSGTNGHSFFSGAGATGITFTFDVATIGFAPTYVGVVWTDGGGTISFEAFDTLGMSLGISMGTHAGSGFSGQVDEDRFYGAENAAGIGSLHISNSAGGIEVDHLQFGRSSSANDDCNANRTADKCQLVGNDGNFNGVPDDCESR